MEDQIGYCVKCQQKKKIVDPMRTKLPNPRTKNKCIDTIKGKCPDCGGAMYHVVGHG